jgi:propionate CoA-transferase
MTSPWLVSCCVALAVPLLLFALRRSRQRRKRNGGVLTVLEKAWLVRNLVRFRLTWGRHDSNRQPAAGLESATAAKVKANPRFVTPAEAVAKIPDGACVLNCGFGANEVCYPFYMGIAERFDACGSPKGLTWLTVNANGSRGVAPGSVDELARPGLVARYIAGHLETAKAMLRAGEAGTVELYNLPIGTLAELVARQARGEEPALVSEVGLGTFLDPRVGNAGRITPNCGSRFITVADSGLRYAIPTIDVVVMNAKAVDTLGNVYFHKNSTLTESIDGALAAKWRGGLVLVSTQHILDAPPVGIPPHLILDKDLVDYICVCDAPRMMDPIGITSKFTCGPPESRLFYEHAWETLRFINRFIRATPRRTEVDMVLGRLASTLFVDSFRGAKPTEEGLLLGTIGIGLPEEVSHNIFRAGIAPAKISLCTESGTIGGLPGMGLFFGAAVRPQVIMSEAGLFQHMKGRLRTTCLGALQVDIHGNVNVSRRGPNVTDCVGSGGFPNFVNLAEHIIFVFSWASGRSKSGAGIHIREDRLVLSQRAKCKLVMEVDEITFSAAEARRLGKKVQYCTNVGVFALSDTEGLVLTHTFRGIDPRDIVAAAGGTIRVSESLRLLETDIITGEGFQLSL